jgi:cytochrome c oxidase subunit 2
MLDPAGTGAERVAGLTWLLFAIGGALVVLFVVLVLWAAARRRGPDVQVTHGGRGVVLVAGLAIPAAILTLVYGIGLQDMRALQKPAEDAAFTVDVIGHIWWWEVRYPGKSSSTGGDVVTANEIHIPTGQVVHVRLTTADVNHSFWVPKLMPKTDLVAGRVNDTWLQATEDGTFRGRCAEYCGLQHANMQFLVVAQPKQQFDQWLQQQAQPAADQLNDLQRKGKQVFENASCASCHTMRGTTAHGDVGPDLTHLASRQEIGAGAAPNTRGYLSGWIADSQTLKPGNKMPPQPLSPEDLKALVAYLEAGQP